MRYRPDGWNNHYRDRYELMEDSERRDVDWEAHKAEELGCSNIYEAGATAMVEALKENASCENLLGDDDFIGEYLVRNRGTLVFIPEDSNG